MSVRSTHLLLSRKAQESIVIIDSSGREVARVTLREIRRTRVLMSLATQHGLHIARGEKLQTWQLQEDDEESPHG